MEQRTKRTKRRVRRRHPWWKRGRVGLNGLDAYFTFLFGTCFADPDDTAANRVQLIAWNDLDDLSALEMETASEPETFGRAIDNQAGNTLRMRPEVDDHTGTLFCDDTLRATALMSGKGGH